jgi:hypothetical protein
MEEEVGSIYKSTCGGCSREKPAGVGGKEAWWSGRLMNPHPLRSFLVPVGDAAS